MPQDVASDAGSAGARRSRLPRIPAEDRRHAAGERAIHLREDQRDRAVHASGGNLHALRRCAAAADRARRSSWSCSVRAMKFASTSIRRSCLRCLRAGCAITSSRPTAMKKIWTSTPPKATSSRRCHFSGWATIRIPPGKSFPLDDAHVNYLLEYNTRHVSGNEQRGYWFDYGR